MEVNEAFIAEWLKHESLWDIKAKAYKDRIGRENNLRIILNYFCIAKASPKQFLVFFFVQCFFFLELSQWQFLQLQVPRSLYFKLKQRSKSLRKQVYMIVCLKHRIISYKSYRSRAPQILKPNKSHTCPIIQTIPCKIP